MKFLLVQSGDFLPAEMIICLKNKGCIDQVNFLENLEGYLEKKSYKTAFLSPDNFSDNDFFKSLELLKKQKCEFIIFSDRIDRSFIENCYKLGCSHYLGPPISVSFFENLIGKESLRSFLSKKIKTYDFDFWSQIESIDNLALGFRPLHLIGPTGVGKTKLAQLVHEFLFGAKKNFVSLNCAEISESLIESELFGYKKGAFTGAITDKKGLVSLANGGTLFLDEIATMPLRIQKKILKVLDEKSFLPVGSEKRESSDFFLISATCEDLFELMKFGKFRKDLYYRIEGFTLSIRGIRERRGDIPLLIDHFLGSGPRKIIFSNEAMEILLNYDWPGNIRELLNFVECLRMVNGGIIKEKHLGEKILRREASTMDRFKLLSDSHFVDYIRDKGLTDIMERLEGEILNHFYLFNKRKVRKTAADLKISNNTFYRIKKRISI
jgi:transcriptional regulator with PAS, ATPase and Fis domain